MAVFYSAWDEMSKQGTPRELFLLNGPAIRCMMSAFNHGEMGIRGQEAPAAAWMRYQ